MRKAKILSAFIFLFCLAINPGVAETSSTSKHKSSGKHATSSKHGTSAKGSSKHHYARHHRANRSQGPTVEQVPQEIFPPGHKFTPEEKAEASEIGAMVQNGLWKEAFKAATKAGKQHPERWWLQAARAAAASNLNRPKDMIDAVNAAIQSNAGDANRLNLAQLYTLRANAYSRLGRKSEALEPISRTRSNYRKPIPFVGLVLHGCTRRLRTPSYATARRRSHWRQKPQN